MNTTSKDENVKEWKEFWPSLQETTRLTENMIDKKVYGIAAGGIGIEVAGLSLINCSYYQLLAILSALFFTITLLINLYSHVRSLKSQEIEGDAIEEFANNDAKTDDTYIYSIIKKENSIIAKYNIVSIWTMVIAIGLLFAYIFLNLYF